MMSEDKKPAIRFKGFTEAWEQRELGEVGNIITGSTPSTAVSKYYSSDGIPWVTPTDISENITYDTEKRLSVLGQQVGRVVPKNTILVTCIASIGKNTMLGTMGSFNQQINGLVPNEKLYNPYFLFTESNLWSAEMKKSAAAGTMQIVNRTEFSKLKSYFPKLVEQDKIADCFRNLDRLITLHQRKYDKLVKVKKSMLEKMFPKNGSEFPEIRFKGFTEAWEQRELGEVGNIITGSTPSTAVSKYYSSDGIPWVTPTDISENITYDTEKRLSVLGQQVGRVVPKNTILVTCIASIGKNTMLGTMGSFNQQINGLVPNEKLYNPYFLFTESNLWSAEMKKSAAAGTMQIVNRTEFSKLKSYFPKLVEQDKIADCFRNLDRLITLHQRKYDKLVKVKKSMLEKMFPKNGSEFPEIRFKGFTEAWEQRELGEVADKVVEKNTFNRVTETFTNSAEFGVISQRDFFDHDISKADKIDGYYVIQNEDFVYNPRISVSAPCGPINCNRLGRNGVMSPLYTVFRTHEIDTVYLEWYFKSSRWHSYMYFNGDSGARSDRFSIKNDLFFAMPVPLPTRAEQEKIGQFFRSLDNLITLHQRK